MKKKHAHNINICYFNLGKTNCHKNHFVSNFQFSNCTSPYMSSIGTFTSFGPHLIPNQSKVSIFSIFILMKRQNYYSGPIYCWWLHVFTACLQCKLVLYFDIKTFIDHEYLQWLNNCLSANVCYENHNLHSYLF